MVSLQPVGYEYCLTMSIARAARIRPPPASEKRQTAPGTSMPRDSTEWHRTLPAQNARQGAMFDTILIDKGETEMTLSRAVAAATFATGLVAISFLAQALPANAQFYSDDSGFERRYGSSRRGGFVMEPDYGNVNRGYRRYDRYMDDDRAYRRRVWRDRWSDPYGAGSRYQRWRDEDERDFQRWRNGDDFAEERDTDRNDEVRSGGPRPAIAAKAPPLIDLRTDYKPGTIIIDQSARKLFYIVSTTTAYQYPISVGREGFSWTGSETVSRIADWPDWHPPEEMRDRDPKLPVKMTGGVNNPLGAKAIYLGKTLYRIHGTNDPKSIGRAASSGCFRMMNQHVLHLAGLVEIGAEVHVLKELPKKVAASQ